MGEMVGLNSRQVRPLPTSPSDTYNGAEVMQTITIRGGDASKGYNQEVVMQTIANFTQLIKSYCS